MTESVLEPQTLAPITSVLQVKKLDARATLPAYCSQHAAGMDLSALLADGQELTIDPMQIVLVPTGLAIAIEPGFEAQIRPRSGLSTKHGISMPNAPGTIDADYRGELKVPLINLGREPYTIMTGMRIAQMVIAPVARARIESVTSLSETARGEGGFGSTGM
ncbi:MAG: dUTP diphosphatase [Phycisphaeraceae bacterium]|nr:dUTP diphosphatase [Phycisphaerales bacterium]MCB9859498.1 dUTP diphosphatase [Phycisphaeraceae bacterium]